MSNTIIDLIDDIANQIYDILVVDNKKITFLECLTYTYQLAVNEDIKSDSIKNNENIKSLVNNLFLIKYSNEELRNAMLLAEIKAYKHMHYQLDLITPDKVGVIFAFLIDLAKYPFENIRALNINTGCGNLISTIANYSKNNFEFICLENNEIIANYLVAKANFIKLYMSIYIVDSLDYNYSNIDIIIGDIPNYKVINKQYNSALYKKGVRDFSYLAIEKHLSSGNDSTTAYYLVDNDFFSYDGNHIFKEEFDKLGYIKAIIVLPENFTKSRPKMILVIKKKTKKTLGDTSIFTMPNYQDQDNWQKTLINIKNYLEE